MTDPGEDAIVLTGAVSVPACGCVVPVSVVWKPADGIAVMSAPGRVDQVWPVGRGAIERLRSWLAAPSGGGTPARPCAPVNIDGSVRNRLKDHMALRRLVVESTAADVESMAAD